MGWLETRGALLRQLRGVLERNGWEDDVGNYEYLAYRKGGWYPKDHLMRTGGLLLNCTITPYRPDSRPTITGYWTNLRNPIKKPNKRRKLRRFRTAIDKDINEAMVLSRIESLFGGDLRMKVTVDEAAKILKCSKANVYQQIHANRS